jgi:acyl-CoA reductase-like NAD-dependent aldehyde dehydrogenase
MVVESSDHFDRRIERAPQGVVFVIAPWNYPFLTAINTIVPALIAGNSVVLKQASQTLLAGERLAEAFHAGGVPEGVFQNVVLDHAGTEALIAARSFGFVNFTGSVAGGQAIERAAAGTFTALGLELGGKDPGYVMEDADVDWAVDVLMDGAMFNAGQCCCGIERIYVHQRHFDDFVGKAVDWANRLTLGNPLDAATTLGPMAHARFARTVRDQTAEAVAQGAKPLIERQNFPQDNGGAYLMPQVLVNVDHSMRVMREESFGPVVGIMAVKDDEEALSLMNDSPYGLTASLWTADPDRALDLGRRIDTGTVFLNRADYLDPAVCWTGCKDTGRGGSLSVLGYHAVTRPRSYHLRKVKA